MKTLSLLLKTNDNVAAGEGFEYHLLVLGLALIVLICGAGKRSVDAVVPRQPANK